MRFLSRGQFKGFISQCQNWEMNWADPVLTKTLHPLE
jgi:hypothetical protein